MKPTTKAVATSVAAATFAASVVSVVVPFTKGWEGTDLVAKRDMIGTGHPLTYCHGQTDEFGAVKVGQRFTPAQCDALLAKSLPRYLVPLQRCIKVVAPVKVIAAALDAAYNAGPTAVCKSEIVERINAGDFSGACRTFLTYREVNGKRVYLGWYIRASGRVVQGLINRRADEQRLCFEGVWEGLPKPAKPWWQKWANLVLFRTTFGERT